MAQQLRAIRRRITSVRSTQKITRSFELIASARIIKAQQRVEPARPYSEQMRALIASVGRRIGRIEHPLLEERDEIRSIATIVITSDRGLAGAYNSNVIRAAERDLQAHGKDPKLLLVGKKAVSYFKFRGYNFDDAWTGISDQPTVADARKVADRAAEAFATGEVDEVRIAYTRFESALIQRAGVVKLLPLAEEEIVG